VALCRTTCAAVETILPNLVSNALKYGESAPIAISGAADDSPDAVIRVADSGPGSAEDKRSHIFEKFNRATSHRSVVGYGLSLWTA
jgi:signal transduction histidine kinase